MILAIDALATYRLTRLVTTDKVTHPLRMRVLARTDDPVFEFVTCEWCVGMWVAFGVVAARRLCPRIWSPVATALAFSAVTGLLAENA